MDNIKSEVLTTATLVMAELIKKLNKDIPDTAYVYSEKLDYLSAVKKYRNDNNMSGADKPPLPLMAINRSVMRYAESFGGIGRRSTNHKTIYKLDKELENYVSASVLQAEFDINFLYVTRDMQDMERFEVSYLGHRGFADGLKLSVFVPEVDEILDYHVDFKEGLDDKEINVDDNYYKGIVGKFLVRGYFLIFKGNVSIIKSIPLSIKDFNEALLQQINIEAQNE